MDEEELGEILVFTVTKQTELEKNLTKVKLLRTKKDEENSFLQIQLKDHLRKQYGNSALQSFDETNSQNKTEYYNCYYFDLKLKKTKASCF